MTDPNEYAIIEMHGKRMKVYLTGFEFGLDTTDGTPRMCIGNRLTIRGNIVESVDLKKSALDEFVDAMADFAEKTAFENPTPKQRAKLDALMTTINQYRAGRPT